MPSKNKPNAFVVYAQSMKQQLIRDGHTINGMSDLVAAAGPYWAALPEEEKEVYKRLAKDRQTTFTKGRGSQRLDRRDNTGELIADRVNVDEVKRHRQFRERSEVTRQWPPGRDVIYEKFYFISFTLMLDLRHLANIDDEQKAIPCEVSILEYSLDQGISRLIHKFINPGPPPLGFRSTAISKSENSHKIPIEGLAGDESYSQIYNELCSFVMVGKKVVPPVFCKASEVEQTEFALKWLSVNAKRQPILKKVYELEGLLLDLESHLVGKKPDFLSDAKATSYLNRSVYDYERNTRCHYHEEHDVKFCSSGVVNKWGFLFSDFLCPKADVPITANHLPCVDSDLPYIANDRRVPLNAASCNEQAPSIQHPLYHHQQQQQHLQQQQQSRAGSNVTTQQQRQRATAPGNQMPQQQERDNSTGVRDQVSNNNKPPLIGRGRGLAQILSQQRRPGEKPKEPQKLVAGRGRASLLTNLQTDMAPLRAALDASITESNQEPSARPKSSGSSQSNFALTRTAPAASFAPQPPISWKAN